jgi:putative riboflavin transport system substrate-binding protein
MNPSTPAEVLVPVSQSRPLRRRSSALTMLLAAGMLVAACSGTGAGTSVATGSPDATAPASDAPTPTAVASAEITPGADPVPLNVGLGFIPNVQFAPFYLADQAGYYEEAGLDVTFRHGTDYDVIALVGQGDLDLGLADGTSVIPAVSQGIPITYIATIYGKFPSIVFAKASSGISAPGDLAGVKLGIPGRYGSSWIMLQALLGSAGLTPDDLDIVEYPDYGQGAAVAAGAVDAATGFANNEPVQLELSGEPASVLHVDDIVPLPGNGLIAGNATLAAKRQALGAFVAQTLRAMAEIAANPEIGLDATYAAVPELAATPDVQTAVLDATIDVWEGDAQANAGYGAIDPRAWTSSIEYMTTLGLVPNPVTADKMLDASLLPVHE